MPIEVDVRKDGIGIVRIDGEVNVGPKEHPVSVDKLKDVFNNLIGRDVESGGPVTKIALDLTRTTFIVSRGFGQMLVALARCRTRSGDLVVFGARGSVWVAASTVGLDNIIWFYSNEEEAIEKLNENGKKDD